ncbi:MAG: AhpC/TSA family protein [Planctomycetota bacterium]|nr:AhpC/TSA family protein [Planctomycetota bacterium]
MFREGLRPPDPFGERAPVESLTTQDGMTIASLSRLGTVCVLCLPALGLRRTRALLDHVASRRLDLEGGGLRLVLVHMAGDARAHEEFEPFDLHYVARISDPERALYEHFGLARATWMESVGLNAWKAAWAGRKHGAGDVAGEPDRLHGVFHVAEGAVVDEWRASAPGDLPEL